MSLLVECSNISKSFGSNQVLSSLTCSINEGELFFLLGPSGCGKTTLLRIIAGLIKQDHGRLSIAGQEMSGIAPEKRGLGMVFQNYALWPHLNVKQHIEFGLANKKDLNWSIPRRVDQILDLLQISTLAQRYPHELSGGQQQRVSLARALAPHPRLLLLDEPLSNLDPTLREEMRQELRLVQRELALTFIYVTHDRSEALAIGDRAAIMNKGLIEQIGTPTELYFKPKNAFVAEFLGETNLLSAQLVINTQGLQGVNSIFGFLERPKEFATRIDDSQVRLSIRPEDIVIITSETRNSISSLTLKCMVEEILPLGIVAYVKLRIAEGQTITAAVRMRDSLRLEVGGQAEIDVVKENIHWLQD